MHATFFKWCQTESDTNQRMSAEVFDIQPNKLCSQPLARSLQELRLQEVQVLHVRWTQESEVPQGPNTAKLQHLGLHQGKHMLQPLMGLQDTRNPTHHWSTTVSIPWEIPDPLNRNLTSSRVRLFWLPGITNLIFLKYMQGLEGVGTQTVCRRWQHLETFLGCFQVCSLQTDIHSSPYSNNKQCVLHFTGVTSQRPRKSTTHDTGITNNY